VDVTWSFNGVEFDVGDLTRTSGTFTTFDPDNVNTVADQIHADDGSGHTDDTGNITVNPGALHHFTFTTQPQDPSATGGAITIEVQAHDAYGNLVTGYTGAGIATISDNTGTVSETAPGAGDDQVDFALGIYNGTVYITEERFNNVITVRDNPGGPGTGNETGNSWPFDVIGSTVPVSLDSSRAPKNALTDELDVEMMEITIYNNHPTDDIIQLDFDFHVFS